MALGTRFDFPMHRGDQRCITFRVVDQQDPPVAVNLTGVTLEWNISKKKTDAVEPLGAVLLTTKLVGTGITIVDAVLGLAEILLASVDTVGLKAPADYYHELQVTAGGVPTTIMYGVITLSKDLLAPGP